MKISSIYFVDVGVTVTVNFRNKYCFCTPALSIQPEEIFQHDYSLLASVFCQYVHRNLIQYICLKEGSKMRSDIILKIKFQLEIS